VTAWIMVNFGWQTAFYAAAILGLLVALAWFLYATDRPEAHPHVNAAEIALIERQLPEGESDTGSTPTWNTIIRTPTVWWLVLSYSCLGYVAYVYMSWFYLYLVNVRGFGVLRGALFASGPFLAMAVFCPLGGWMTDRLVIRWGINRGRAVVGGTGMILAAVSIVWGAFTESPYAAIALLSLGAGWLYFPVGAYWSSTVDISKRHAGTLSGLMNTGANLGGALSPTFTPWLAEQAGWSVALGFAACVALAGGLMWSKIKPGEGVAVHGKVHCR
jgi:MFS transporter, ACS family, glucarate transporter